MTEWFPNCRFFRIISLNNPSNVKKILLTTYFEKTSYFEVANKHIDNLSKKNISIYPNLFYSGRKILFVKKFTNLIDVP